MLRREAFLAGFWGAVGVASVALLLALGYEILQAAAAVSTPFVAAIVVALLCDPLVDRFQKQVGFTGGKRAERLLLSTFSFCSPLPPWLSWWSLA